MRCFFPIFSAASLLLVASTTTTAAAAAVVPGSSSRRHGRDSEESQGQGLPFVDTPTNGRIYGTVDRDNTPDVHQFLSVPYAEPPVGDLRFAPPVPRRQKGQDDDSVFHATELGPACMQYLTTNASIWTREVLQFNLDGLDHTSPHISEDCLTLSIFAPPPPPPSSLLPVLVFIHGGGFRWGGGRQPYNNPSQWIQRSSSSSSPSHIVITLNHRLNIFGFPNALGISSENQNPGLLDQRLALEWIRDNIASFGGDPDRIVLWGQSAGAIASGYYAYAYAGGEEEDPIVKGFIMDSGVEIVDRLTHQPDHAFFSWVAGQVGCDSEEDGEKELECMRGVDAGELEEVIQRNQDAGNLPYETFQPVVDGRTVFEDWEGRAGNGSIAKVPVIIGSNAGDGIPFVTYNPNGVDQEAAFQYTLSDFFCPAWEGAKLRIPNGIPVYRFLYSGDFTNVSPKSWMGAWHGSELPLLFGTHPNYRGNSTKSEYETSRAMQDAWVSFARDPTSPMLGDGVEWPAFTEPSSGLVANFGKDGVPVVVDDVSDIQAMCG